MIIETDGLAKRYGQAAVVENAAGAAGNIGIDKVKRAKGDGHTLLVVPAGNLTIKAVLANGPEGMSSVAVSENQTARVRIVLDQIASSRSRK